MKLMTTVMFATVSLAGCVAADDPAVTTISARETVIDPPRPSAYVNAVSNVVGEPSQVVTSFYGYCHELWDYPCQFQSYSVEIQCVGGPCEVEGDGFVAPDAAHPEHATHVRPLAAGPLTIRAFVNGALLESRDLVTYVPDHIAVTCHAGRSIPAQPCTTGVNPSPVAWSFQLMAGDLELNPDGPGTYPNGHGPFTVTADRSGSLSFHYGEEGYGGDSFTSYEHGQITGQVAYRDLVADFEAYVFVGASHDGLTADDAEPVRTQH
jgi:hypothetical protein